MKNKREDIVMAVFVADALSFGSHWVYNTDKLKEEYTGIINEFRAPMSNFHEGKEAGDLSHYGEQAIALLRSISENKGFNLKKFKADWIEHVKNTEMYMDHSMKDTLEIFEDSDTLVGADNVELGGIARSLPLFIEEDISKKEFMDLVHLTHNGEVVDQTAEFVFQVIKDILDGKSYKEAIETNKDINSFIEYNFNKIGSKDKIVENADDRGQGCSIQQGLPIVLDVLWNADDLMEALTLNIMAAGDNCPRGMVIAAIMAASKGLDAIPKKLIAGFNKSEEVRELI